MITEIPPDPYQYAEEESLLQLQTTGQHQPVLITLRRQEAAIKLLGDRHALSFQEAKEHLIQELASTNSSKGAIIFWCDGRLWRITYKGEFRYKVLA